MTSRRDDWDETERATFEPLGNELGALVERHRQDPPLDLLRAARVEALPEPLQEQVAARLDSSSWCRAVVAGADEADPSLDQASLDRLLARVEKEAARTDGRERTRRWIWAPALAVASLAVVVLVVVISRNASAPQPAPATAERQPAATLPAPRPAFTLPLDKPDVKLTALALTVRGEGRSGRFVDDAAAGLNAFRSDDYASAARELEGIEQRYPRSVELPFYVGVSRLFLNDAPAAIEALEAARAINDESFNDDVTWYLAVAHERAGAGERSRALLESLCRGGSAYSARACDAAGRLR